ncbi:MAG: hypothetical protein PF440_11910 [Thiomicrorhabdus sp.]|jgi:hypothetical protein|nr:hypothetical protein [Thiomicrorhabdus sp.]
MSKRQLNKSYDAKIKKTAKQFATVPPTTYYHPMIFYQNNYYRFYDGKCFIGTYARDEKHWSDKCCLSWFNYDISMDLMIKLEKHGSIITRKKTL